ncbi:VPLPA-CTERM sorting domain-containing protein [Celeribacter neptunius]|uniref:VPLPA-CTERM protein sorting domain-containing protein n=1 Tax=Celeribacter neptunius TaxID=588602 RepID=A0A1I3IKG2_9RHOB|nr:VPLPA-CTERM sorting domain-containing protein [Celeribacter neptunius]SFI48359.1 VPLPA-CTERM protein sorting domain-containing protein [Celeribacter neptunius]
MKALFISAAILASATAANAATLDFSGIQGFSTGSAYVPGGATITHESGGGILAGPGVAGHTDGFCFLTSSYICEAGGTMAFDTAVTNLTFDIDGAAPTYDSVEIFAYLSGGLVSSFLYDSGDQGVTDFSSYVLDTLVFVDSSTAAGVGYSTFSFDIADIPAVPLPASALLLLGAVGSMGALRRKRKG